MRYLVLLVVLMGCAEALPYTKSAFDAVAPHAVDILTKAIRDRFGTEPERDSAQCFEVPDFEDDDGFVYVVCRARAPEE